MLCADPATTPSFDDGRAFRLKRTSEIVRALTVFRLCSVPVLVTHCDKLLSFSRSLLGPRLFSLLMRATAYGQFVAGETVLEIRVAMDKLSMMGMRPMLAVPIEEDLGENREGVCISVYLCLSVCVLKRIAVLLSHPGLSEQFSLTRLLHAMEGQEVRFSGLSDSEASHFLCGLRRLHRVGEYAKGQEVRVLVDAEYTYINPALTLVTMAMMKKFNQSEPWIWNTYQCYLKRFCFGVKLVRGAYMDKERKLANEQSYPDPIHQSWESTNHSYHQSLDMMLDLIAKDSKRYSIIIASHNEDSVKHAMKRSGLCYLQVHPVRLYRLRAVTPLLSLLPSPLSLSLSGQGYAIYKSIPYGSIDSVL
ncbi:UNVERIFIED_CONTAM: hypothetical protein FKN15_011069 [Acipenser sinensis]